MKHGLLLVDKEPGCTSHDVVQRVRRLARQRKIGHCGTLDPDATGLLVLTLGKATRLTRFLINAPKEYGGRIRFGVSTDTYDAAGEVTRRTDARPEPAAVATAMTEFVGTFEQQAPPFSAKKVQGVKYYELARRGQEVPKATKPISVFEFRPERTPTPGHLDFRLACSTGTYVRSLAHDLGERLGCGAHLESLRRLKVGPFAVDAAIELGELERRLDSDEALGESWIPFDEIPLPFPEVVADPQQERRILHGQTVLIRSTECEEGDWMKLVNNRRRVIAVGSVVERIGERGVGVVRPRIVFP